MALEKIITIEELNEVIQQESFVLFKASDTCNISHDAFLEFERFMEKHSEVKAYYLYVQEARPLSNFIAEKYQLKHQSPQVLYIKEGKLAWNESHWRITEASLQEHIR